MNSAARWGRRVAAAVYGGGVRLRNWLYDRGVLPSWRPPVRTLVVGNLSAGGAGKTPMVMTLVEWLQERGVSAAVLSRGYGRRSAGLREVMPEDSFEEVGDEPLLIKQTHPGVPVVVSIDRREGIEYLIDYHRPAVVVMDDGFQHRRIRPTAAMVLMSYHHPYDRDALLPLGRLREPLSGLRRADALVVTKVPEVHRERATEWRQRLRLPAALPVFEVPMQYGGVRWVAGPRPDAVRKPMAVAGIAEPQPFAAYLAERFPALRTRFFPDHHPFTEEDMRAVWAEARRWGCDALLTTEKDWVRLRERMPAPALPVGVLPMRFVPGEALLAWLEKVLNIGKTEGEKTATFNL